MANTINDLYLKYVNKVGKTLENDRYFQYLFEMVRSGNTTLQQNHKILHKQVDERWLSLIEDSLDALNRITEQPRRFIVTNEEVVPVALARKITADSVRHLSMNTQFITSNKNGDIQPTRVLNVSVEETYDLYENRFIYHLIQRLVTFIDKRTDIIFWSTGDETCNTLRMHSVVDDAYEQIEYNLEMKVKNARSVLENDSDNMQVFMRIDRVRRLVMALRRSSFCEIMAGCSIVRSPIQRTNAIMKDPDYRTCYKLWQFLESYEEVGYSIEERDTPLEFDEEYQIQLFSNLITNYTVFKSLMESDPRKLSEIPPKRKKITKPRFIKKIEEEIVTDYDIPDVEIRKVIIEEVTQAQLDAEAKLQEEIARREGLQAELEDAQRVFEEFRLQAEFQRAEAERQAEDRLMLAKETAEKERQELLTAMEAAKQAAADALAAEKQAAAQKEAELLGAMEAAKQAAADALAAQKQAAAQKEAELLGAMEAAKQAAADALAAEKQAAAQKEAELLAAMEAAKQAAADALAAQKQTSAQKEAELLAAMEAAKQAARAEQEQIQAQAAEREAALKEAVKAAEDDAYKARYRRREITAALKRAEAALKTVQQKLDDTSAREQAALAREQAAMEREQAALDREQAALQAAAEAQARAEENTLPRRILDAVTQRRSRKEQKSKEESVE